MVLPAYKETASFKTRRLEYDVTVIKTMKHASSLRTVSEG